MWWTLRLKHKNWLWVVILSCGLLIFCYADDGEKREQERVNGLVREMQALYKGNKVKELERKRDAAETEAEKRHYQELLDQENNRLFQGNMAIMEKYGKKE